MAFKAKDQAERKRVQSKLRKEIREAKKQYKEKKKRVQFQFQTGNSTKKKSNFSFQPAICVTSWTHQA